MFEPSQDYANHPSPTSSSIQQPEHVDHEMLTATITTTTNNDDDDQQFYQDLLTMERMLPSSSTSSLSSTTSSKMVTSIVNNNTNNINDNSSGLNHFNQFQTPTGQQQQEQSQTNQEYQIETSSNSQQQQCLNSTNSATGTTNNSNDDFETLMNHQDDGSMVTESFLFKDFDEQTAIIDNHHHQQQQEQQQQQQQQHEQQHNHSNLNHADSSSSHSLDYSPKMKMMKSSPSSENMINANDNQNANSSSIDPLLTSTTANGHNQHCQNSENIDSANSTAAILNTEDLAQQQQQQQHHHEQEHDQSSFDYVDSLMSEYQVDSGVGVDSGNGDSSEACHDFLTNLEVDDPETKHVVEQFIAVANAGLGDASTSLITSSEDILQQATTEANVVNCMVNDSWFQQPSEQNSQATFVESNVKSGSTLPAPTLSTLVAPKSEESSVSETKSSKKTKSAGTKLVMMKNESTSTTNHTKLLVDNTNNNKSLTTTTNTSSADNHCLKQQQTAPQSTKNSSTTSPAATTATVLSPTAEYLSCNDHDEIPRHTICPLCDNSRAFCSSSSVTRHIRSVHKLTDMTDTKYNYCTLCQVFQEDINAYYQHLQQDHQFDLQKNFSILFTKRIFQTFEEFQTWKEQELETQTGCRYERCFSYDYPRSAYYKCSGIHLRTLKTQNDTSTSNDSTGQQTEPMQQSQQIMIQFNNQPGPKIETANLSKIIAAALNNNNNNNSQDNAETVTHVCHHPNALRIENQADARMYPCPSSVRLIFRKNHILVNYIPIHLGHVLNAGVPLPPRTSLTNTTQPQSTTTVASNSKTTGTTAKQSRASSGVSGKNHNTKASKKQLQNQMVQTTATAKQIQIQSPTPKPATVAKTAATSTVQVTNNQTQHATQVVAIANPNQLAGLANLQLTASSGGGHQLVGHHPTSKTQLLHLPVVNLVGGNLGNLGSLGNLVLTTSPATSVGGNNSLENNATTTFHVQIPVSSIGSPTNNVHQTKQANIVQVAANRAGSLQTVKTHFIQPVNDVSIQNDTLTSIGTATTTTTASGAAYQLNFSTFDGQQQQPTILTSTKQQQQQRPTFIATNTNQQIRLQVRTQQPQQSQPTLILNNHHPQINSNTNDKNKRAETTTVTYQQQSYHPADSSSSSSIDAGSGGSVVVGQQIPLNQIVQNPSMATTTSAATTTATNNNGLVIVSLEKGMEMVQERFRPRKEHLRLVFEQLLNNCLTEADFDLIESSLVSITNHLQLNPSSSASTSSQNHNTFQVIQASTLAAASSKPV